MGHIDGFCVRTMCRNKCKGTNKKRSSRNGPIDCKDDTMVLYRLLEMIGKGNCCVWTRILNFIWASLDFVPVETLSILPLFAETPPYFPSKFHQLFAETPPILTPFVVTLLDIPSNFC